MRNFVGGVNFDERTMSRGKRMKNFTGVRRDGACLGCMRGHEFGGRSKFVRKKLSKSQPRASSEGRT